MRLYVNGVLDNSQAASGSLTATFAITVVGGLVLFSGVLILVGAVAMTLAQSLIAIIIFWAIIGGLGASLLLPAMQSLIHGNFEGAAQKATYALARKIAFDYLASDGMRVRGFLLLPPGVSEWLPQLTCGSAIRVGQTLARLR